MLDINEFSNISIRGRVAFCIAALKIYVDAKYPEADYASIYKMAAPIIDGAEPIDEAAMAYMEIIPEYLYEFDNYADAEFDYLTEEQYKSFISIVTKNDEKLNVIMHSIYDVAFEYCYVALQFPAKDTYQYIEKVVHILEESGLEAPDIDAYKKYDFSVYDGWGDFIDMAEI